MTDQKISEATPLANGTSRRRFVLTFILIWLTQFMVYCLRKPVGVLKIQVEKSMGVSRSQLGLVDVR